ncbi:Type 1 glutamine amidotransferase-like domain-containing protein [Candidatus Gottesmanbacteria bacterium]|nr:Type 1 glutamine amidotransferase-like domain-containing protein [Candidatus Gottesmanbacteria bacterium]
MKLFLTSNGLTNYVLRNKFVELLEKNPKEANVAFINTASKVQDDNGYVETDLQNLKKTGVKNISLVDISEPKENWQNNLFETDVIWMEGGNTFYLLEELRKSGLTKDLKDVVKEKLYVGVSAGSIIVGPTITIANVEPPDINSIGMTDFSALSWVNFELSPHTTNFVPLENVEKFAKESPYTIYAYDDNVALLIQNEKVGFVGNGFNKIFLSPQP